MTMAILRTSTICHRPKQLLTNWKTTMRCGIEIVLKFFVYFVLFIAFLKIYLVKQTTEFLEGRTTFSSSYEKSHDTEFPSILICFSPPFKNKKGKSLILALPDNDYGSYKAQCLKITPNVAFQFLNFDIFHQFLTY